jgi:preprotein translocase subunit SecG
MLYEGELRAGFFKVGEASVGGKERAVMSNFGGVEGVLAVLLLLLAVCFCVLAVRAAVTVVMLRENCLDCIRVG